MITVYSAPWCGHCHRLKSQLDRAGIPYTEVDVDQEPDATTLIAGFNGGDWLIPTVVFPDGTALVNPGVADVRRRLTPPEAPA
ncbi:glutaredoxin domain-containing protein [Actinocorallia sp. B10E7]|uniref:glutaredoxin domain-containing protein n=1 Tax=Actinocorallia sp. B10E7 TaxID=3153558 RepID=UPI00325D54C4